MDNNSEDKYNHTGLEQNSKLHLRTLKAFNKHKLVKNHNAKQYPFDY